MKPDDYQKLNAVLKFSAGDETDGWSLTAMGYHGTWNSSDQAAQRAFARGLPRFGSLDETTGGDSQRYSVLFDWHRGDERSLTKLLLYGSYYDLDLFSNFTYFLDDPVHGDQFEQHDRRVMLGAKLSQQWQHELFGRKSETTVGVQIRHDNIRNGLFRTEETERLESVRYDHVFETSVGFFAEEKTRWTPWLRSSVGVRGDIFRFDTHGIGDGGNRTAGIVSPKAALIFGPWANTEFYLNGGLGFHSNDARGVTAGTNPANPLVRTKGAEIGVRTSVVPGLQSTLTAWTLDIDSELVFVGDAGNTEAGRASRRFGIEFANFYEATPWLTLDADFAWSQARFREKAPEGQRIPGSIETVVSAGATVHDLPGALHGWFGSVCLRYFGPRDLIENGSARSDSSALVYLQAGYQINERWKATVDVFNLFDSEVNDIDYFYTSRLRGEREEGFDDFHVHPVEPRSVRFTVSTKF